MHGIETKDDLPIEQAQIAQAEVLGQDLLLAFSNGTSILVDGEQVKTFALETPKKIVDAHDDLDGADADGTGPRSR